MNREYVEQRNGGMYLMGTRVSLDSVVRCFSEGLSPEAIREEFPVLTLAQVYGAITYFLENQPEVDSYLLRQAVRFEQERKAASPLPEALRRRLEEARARTSSRP